MSGGITPENFGNLRLMSVDLGGPHSQYYSADDSGQPGSQPRRDSYAWSKDLYRNVFDYCTQSTSSARRRHSLRALFYRNIVTVSSAERALASATSASYLNRISMHISRPSCRSASEGKDGSGGSSLKWHDNLATVE